MWRAAKTAAAVHLGTRCRMCSRARPRAPAPWRAVPRRGSVEELGDRDAYATELLHAERAAIRNRLLQTLAQAQSGAGDSVWGECTREFARISSESTPSSESRAVFEPALPSGREHNERAPSESALPSPTPHLRVYGR